MEGETHLMEMQELIQELMKKETQCNISEVIENLFNEIENMNQESGNESQKSQIEESAVNLWNWTVMRKMGPTISDLQRIKLRHIACKLMMFCEVSNPPEEMMQRQILMAMKTGKGWVDEGNLTLANEFLEIAMNSLEKFYAQLTKKSTSEADTHMHKADVEKDVFKVLSYQAESAVAEGDFQKAVTCVQRCKDILMRLPKESCYLSLLCYNFGVETYKLKIYEQSSFWLSQSYEIGKMDKTYSPGQEMLAKVLRLLATVYLEWDYKEYQDKAIRAITMANEENLHPAGFFLKIKILLKGCTSDEDIRSAVTELLQHKFPLDNFLNTAKLLLEHERETIGFDFLKSVTQLFEGSPDVGKAILLHIELLLQRMKEPLAKKMIEDITASHNTRKQLTPEILNHLHHVLWDRAARNYEVKRYSEALSWYKYSLCFYSSGQVDQNLAKLQRNMAACYLHLQQLENAHESVKEAERCDPNSIFTQFYVYKIAVLEKKSQKAFDAIVAMGKSAVQLDTLLTDGVMATNLLSLAAQIALENEQQSVGIKALEYLSQLLQDNQEALNALKCLIRLVLSRNTVDSKEEITNDMEILLTYLTAALQRLDASVREESKTLDTGVIDANWFRKIAWNLAVQCENCPRTMRDFFVISFKFSQFCPLNTAVLLAQRTCLLMAAAVNLDMGRKNLLPTDQTELLTQAVKHIQSCREIWKVLKQTGDFPKDPTDTLLLLYEFEARAKLNDLSVGSLLDQIWELPQVEIKTLETIASLAMESPAHYPSICKRALKMVLTLLRKQETPDVATFRVHLCGFCAAPMCVCTENHSMNNTYSKCLHSMVCLSLPSGTTEAESYVLEEAWSYFEDALWILGNTVLQACYPQVEIIWLMTRAWNTGIHQYITGRYKEAEQWCGLGMRFLGHLGTLKSSYESQMTCLYSEVLDKLDNTKRYLPKEE